MDGWTSKTSKRDLAKTVVETLFSGRISALFYYNNILMGAPGDPGLRTHYNNIIMNNWVPGPRVPGVPIIILL